MPEEYQGIPLVPEPARARLDERQQMTYREHRRDLIEWLLVFGKHPEKADGYAQRTVLNTAQRLDLFYRWVWDERESFTTDIDHGDADAYMRHLARKDEGDYSRNNTQSAIKRLFKWKAHERGGETWEPSITFTEPSASTEPRDFLVKEERRQTREAALEYGSIPGYSGLTSTEREKWKSYLAQRFSKPKAEVTPEDWEKANSWKFPSLVWASLDAGLRPVEVERATVSWVDAENALLRIPKEESSKNVGNWTVSIREETANALNAWLTERERYEVYEGRDELWLTREGNPYGTSALRHVLKRLFEIAGIDAQNRKISWYMIRHSVGTYMTREEGLAAAQAQLRHKSETTTMRYDQVPVEERRDALDKMG
ncbi:tyrosine-type recombinase/integrase [Haloarcula nitratireducens]|uniref:Tyrosine-type recombinase/integrase n=1 Tax=Haloarcula nitratireducens TaxID=2487749 RepID=A0AAW4PC23_9EURY|nr:site-specific integrase [Halomicroarcula nitratireducens]MBX0295440.1 tyrosine-type recombinase/integrase [Halomicroarcula nitratireducens]